MSNFTIKNYSFLNPATNEQQDGCTKVYLDESGNPTGVEEEYTGMSAEAWLNYKGYNSIRLLTLLDIERKLEAAGESSPKVISTRAWIDSILMQFAMNPAPQLEWDDPQFTFDETLQEALSLLNG